MPENITVHQVVESAYAWANGDMRPGELLDAELCSRSVDFRGTDGLAEFLVRELVEVEGVTPDSPEHWAEALRRAEQARREITSVVHALQVHLPIRGRNHA